MNNFTDCPFCNDKKNLLLCMSRESFLKFTEDGKPTWVWCTCCECGLTVRSKESLDYDEALNDLIKKWNGLRYVEDYQ